MSRHLTFPAAAFVLLQSASLGAQLPAPEALAAQLEAGVSDALVLELSGCPDQAALESFAGLDASTGEFALIAAGNGTATAGIQHVATTALRAEQGLGVAWSPFSVLSFVLPGFGFAPSPTFEWASASATPSGADVFEHWGASRGRIAADPWSSPFSRSLPPGLGVDERMWGSGAPGARVAPATAVPVPGRNAPFPSVVRERAIEHPRQR